jgi:hypothetical protein
VLTGRPDGRANKEGVRRRRQRIARQDKIQRGGPSGAATTSAAAQHLFRTRARLASPPAIQPFARRNGKRARAAGAGRGACAQITPRTSIVAGLGRPPLRERGAPRDGRKIRCIAQRRLALFHFQARLASVCVPRATRQHRVAVRRGAAHHGWAAPRRNWVFEAPKRKNLIQNSLAQGH